MEEKQVIRKRILEQKKMMTELEIQIKSNQIIDVLLELSDYKDADCIYAYINFNQEVVTNRILIHAMETGKKVAVPKIENKIMKFYYINSLDDVHPGYFGILEPVTTEEARDNNGLMIMPGVAFDLHKNRIGYGKGYYDTYLGSHSVNKKIALAYELQIVNAIDADEFDRKPDYILTENRIIY